jgi:hypothetical protein
VLEKQRLVVLGEVHVVATLDLFQIVLISQYGSFALPLEAGLEVDRESGRKLLEMGCIEYRIANCACFSASTINGFKKNVFGSDVYWSSTRIALQRFGSRSHLSAAFRPSLSCCGTHRRCAAANIYLGKRVITDENGRQRRCDSGVRYKGRHFLAIASPQAASMGLPVDQLGAHGFSR